MFNFSRMFIEKNSQQSKRNLARFRYLRIINSAQLVWLHFYSFGMLTCLLLGLSSIPSKYPTMTPSRRFIHPSHGSHTDLHHLVGACRYEYRLRIAKIGLICITFKSKICNRRELDDALNAHGKGGRGGLVSLFLLSFRGKAADNKIKRR